MTLSKTTEKVEQFTTEA